VFSAFSRMLQKKSGEALVAGVQGCWRVVKTSAHMRCFMKEHSRRTQEHQESEAQEQVVVGLRRSAERSVWGAFQRRYDILSLGRRAGRGRLAPMGSDVGSLDLANSKRH
jgi:hypothetical protein